MKGGQYEAGVDTGRDAEAGGRRQDAYLGVQHTVRRRLQSESGPG